jgi:sec-independent protein translocase protein TatB
MFNIGLGELFVIALLALVVVGPERLPSIMREIGKYVYQLRAIVNELTSQFADELRPIQEIQQLAEDLNPVKQVTKVAMSATEPLQQTVDQVNAANQPPAAKPAPAKPAASPTAAFHAAPPHPAANPMKIIGQALYAPEDSPEELEELADASSPPDNDP